MPKTFPSCLHCLLEKAGTGAGKMKRLNITNFHGLTPSELRSYEKQESNANLRNRITAVRLVMEGKLGKEVAEICNLHRQSVSEYIRRFNEGGLERL